MKIKEDQWYRIPAYAGYEIMFLDPQKRPPDDYLRVYLDVFDNEPLCYVVRSYKLYNKFPNGYILKLGIQDGKYELTDISKKRKKLSAQEIYDILTNYKPDTTISEEQTNRGCRQLYYYSTDAKNIHISTPVEFNTEPKKEPEGDISLHLDYLIKKPKEVITFY